MGLLSICSTNESKDMKKEDGLKLASEINQVKEADGYKTPRFLLDPDYERKEEDDGVSFDEEDTEQGLEELNLMLQQRGLVADLGSTPATITPRSPERKAKIEEAKKVQAKQKPQVQPVHPVKNKQVTKTQNSKDPKKISKRRSQNDKKPTKDKKRKVASGRLRPARRIQEPAQAQLLRWLARTIMKDLKNILESDLAKKVMDLQKINLEKARETVGLETGK